MYNVSQNYHNLIKNGAEQNLLVVFDDLYLSGLDQDFEASGAELQEYFNTATDVAIGEAVSSTFGCAVLNLNGYLNSYSWGEGRPYIGVKTGVGTYSKPNNATAYAIYTDANNTNHTIVGYSNRVVIDGTQYSTNSKAVTLIWATDTVVHVQTTTSVYNYTYSTSTSQWTSTTSAVSSFMAAKATEGFRFRKNIMTRYFSDGTTETWEYCPLGVFRFETPSKSQVPVINVTAYDRMTKFDIDGKDYLETEWTYPITLFEMFQTLCEYVGVPFPNSYLTQGFTNSDIEFVAFPLVKDVVTCRELLSYIAEASGNVAVFNRDGELELRWYGQTTAATFGENDIALNQYDVAEYVTPQISSLRSLLIDGSEINLGSGDNTYTILANSFLADYPSRYTAVFNKLQIVGNYIPTIANIITADPSIESGDRVTILSNTIPLMSQEVIWRGYTAATYTATGLAHRELPSTLQRNDFIMARNLTLAEQYADEAVSDYDTALNQQRVFNKLTNNGQVQGIYLNDGNLYINATYIATGVLASPNGKYSLDMTTGSVNMANANITGGEINIQSSSSAIDLISLRYLDEVVALSPHQIVLNDGGYPALITDITASDYKLREVDTSIPDVWELISLDRNGLTFKSNAVGNPVTAVYPADIHDLNGFIQVATYTTTTNSYGNIILSESPDDVLVVAAYATLNNTVNGFCQVSTFQGNYVVHIVDRSGVSQNNTGATLKVFYIAGVAGV